MKAEEEREKFEYFRDCLVRRVWELILTCDEHWAQFNYFIPEPKARNLPYRQMAADSGGHARALIESKFLAFYPDELDCTDGCSDGLYSIIQELRRVKGELVYRNMGLAYRLAFKYTKRGAQVGLEQADVIQHGLVGLCEGVERFRPEFGNRFSTYGSWWIKHGITRAIVNGGLVRLPVHQHTKGKREAPIVSLDAKVSDEESAQTFVELLADEEAPRVQEQLVIRDDVLFALKELSTFTPKEQQVVRMRFGIEPYTEPHTLQEIGEVFDLSRERIRQIQVSVLDAIGGRLRLAS